MMAGGICGDGDGNGKGEGDGGSVGSVGVVVMIMVMVMAVVKVVAMVDCGGVVAVIVVLAAGGCHGGSDGDGDSGDGGGRCTFSNAVQQIHEVYLRHKQHRHCATFDIFALIFFLSRCNRGAGQRCSTLDVHEDLAVHCPNELSAECDCRGDAAHNTLREAIK